MVVLHWANLIAFIAAVASGCLRWGGNSIRSVSASHPTMITPAGFTFTIWVLIYVFVGIYTVWQLLPRATNSANVKAVGRWFLLALIFQGLWTPAFCFREIALSAGSIWGVWVSLFGLNLSLVQLHRKEQREGTHAFWSAQLISFPFSVWFGWITAATLINTTMALIRVSAEPFFASSIWGSIVLTLAASFAAVWGAISFSWPFCLALGWAAFGIFENQSDQGIHLISASLFGGLSLFGLALAILAYVSHRLLLRTVAASASIEDGLNLQEMHPTGIGRSKQATQFYWVAQPVPSVQEQPTQTIQ